MDAKLSQDEIDRINEALFEGRKIDAIKIYRAATRTGLKEAKDFVEAVEERLRSEMPERFVARPVNINLSVLGCALVILASALALAIVVVLMG